MITAIRLRNFKAFKNEVEIPLSPITLLYGPNSSGKSSVLHSLLYLYEILNNDTCDVDKSSFASEIDLGGFWNVIHRDSDTAEFKIGLSYSLSDDVDMEDMASEYGAVDIETLERFSEENNMGIVSPLGEYGCNYWNLDLTVAWSSELNRPYVSDLHISASDAPFGKLYPLYTGNVDNLLTVKASSDLNYTYISDINFDHYLLNTSRNEGDEIELKLIIQKLHTSDGNNDSDNQLSIPIEPGKIGAKPALGKSIKLLLGKKYQNKLQEEKYSTFQQRQNNAVNLDKINNQLSHLDTKIAHTDSVISVLQEFFSQAIVGMLDNTTKALHKMVAIGPIRDIPPRQFVSPRNADKKRWYTGLAAWDAIKQCSDDDFENISRWLFRLKTGYSLFRSMPESKANNSDQIIARQQKYGLYTSKEFDVLIKDTAGNLFHVQDLGTGISQILPIIVAACLREIGLIVIEQPELHIHPRLQVELGDLFAETISKYSIADKSPADDENSYLIETHSEHILLRLLRRIRETSNGNVSLREKQLDPNYVSVIYIENRNGVASVQKLRIDSEGEFIDHWPEGFFRERSDELFS